MVISHEQSASHAASSFDHDLLQKLTPTMRSFTLHGKVAIVTGYDLRSHGRMCVLTMNNEEAPVV